MSRSRSEEKLLLEHVKEKLQSGKVVFGRSQVFKLLQDPTKMEAVIVATSFGTSDERACARFKKERFVNNFRSCWRFVFFLCYHSINVKGFCFTAWRSSIFKRRRNIPQRKLFNIYIWFWCFNSIKSVFILKLILTLILKLIIKLILKLFLF